MPTGDCLIIGGGVIGLSIAYDLACHGVRARIIDRQTLGREASWAGAGILPPPPARETALDPIDQLRALSHELHAEWHLRLKQETGVDNGYCRCGGIYLARTIGEAAALRGWLEVASEQQIEMQLLRGEQLVQHEPALGPLVESGALRAAYRCPDEAQIRNPRHLQALLEACLQRGVQVDASVTAEAFQLNGDRLASVETSAGRMTADSYCLTAGAWTGPLMQRLGLTSGILPMRGQMVLFRCEQPPFRHVLNEGPRYLVPRDDGHVLVGSTEEEVGFDKGTTEEGLRELIELARELVPALESATVEATWAGLRPASFDGFPYIGRVPGAENLYVAAGHFRSGLHLSPATAVVISRLIRGEDPGLDLTPFRVGRG